MADKTTGAQAPLKSDALRDEIRKRQQHGREVVNVEVERMKVVVVVCGDGRYAFHGADIREILPHCPVWWMPGLPAHLPGLINVRGDVESVVDLGHFLGEKNRRSEPLVAMAARDDFQSGILIDAIIDVVDIPAGAVNPPLSTLVGAARELVVGEFDHGGTTVSLLDLGRLAAMVAV